MSCSNMKRVFDFLIGSANLVIFIPLFALIALLIKLDSPGPIIFRQKRVGLRGKKFYMYKFRSMIEGAEEMREDYQRLNEADGPVFKIKNDPRFTRAGKFLAQTGLDELPQLINVLKSEMSLVGPRPLPNYETKRLNSWQKKRLAVLPGMTSPWVIKGKHKLNFDTWMRLDIDYVETKTLVGDIKILLKTAFLVVQNFLTN